MEYILNKNHINCHNLLFKNPVKNQNPDFLNYYKMIYTNNNRWDYQERAIQKIVEFYEDSISKKGMLIKC